MRWSPGRVTARHDACDGAARRGVLSQRTLHRFGAARETVGVCRRAAAADARSVEAVAAHAHQAPGAAVAPEVHDDRASPFRELRCRVWIAASTNGAARMPRGAVAASVVTVCGPSSSTCDRPVALSNVPHTIS